MSVHMEERSGVIPCKTPWGNWSQTMEERSGVFIKVNVPCGTSGKEVKCNLGYKLIELHVERQQVFTVRLHNKHISKLEIMCLICIVLMKMNREAGNSSLLEGEYCADAWLQDQKQRKLTLERFHRGGDTMKFSPISGAEISGNFAGGGPDFYSLQK
uniref:CS domain-containing protein n=1 Tax=Salmo trutta TaxID=8032 RepID=A0A673WEG9_SALTR